MAAAPARTPSAAVRPFPKARYSDAELVELLTRGDQEALRVIWARHAQAVRATLFAAMGPDIAIDDLTQEVFLGLYRRSHQLRNPKALRAYLLGSAVRIAAFECRSRARRRRRHHLLALEPPQPTVELPDVEERDAVRALQRILDSLPERPRMAFLLRYVQDLTPRDVAEALEISETTAKRAIARGRQRVAVLAGREPALRDYLREWEGQTT